MVTTVMLGSSMTGRIEGDDKLRELVLDLSQSLELATLPLNIILSVSRAISHEMVTFAPGVTAVMSFKYI